MITGTNFLTDGAGSFNFITWGFIAIGVFTLFSIIRQGAVIGPLFRGISLCIAWLPLALVLSIFGFAFGLAGDSWETKNAEREDREVRLYNGETTPTPEDTPIPTVPMVTGVPGQAR